MKIEIDKIKCFYCKGIEHTPLDMTQAENQGYRNLLVSIIIAFERVEERAPKFVVFNDTLPNLLKVLIFRADVEEDDLWDKDWKLLSIRQELDEQVKANAHYNEETGEENVWVKFEVL